MPRVRRLGSPRVWPGEYQDLPLPRTWTWENPSLRPTSGSSTGPSQRRSPRVWYDVKAEDIIVAGGAAFAAAYGDEAAMLADAIRYAREFNDMVEKGDAAVDSLKDWLKADRDERVRPKNVTRGDTSTSPYDRERAYDDSDTRRRGRKREYDERGMPIGAFQPVTSDLRPGKVPPGYRPGLGPGGTRARGGKIRGRTFYEKL